VNIIPCNQPSKYQINQINIINQVFTSTYILTSCQYGLKKVFDFNFFSFFSVQNFNFCVVSYKEDVISDLDPHFSKLFPALNIDLALSLQK